MTKEEAIAYARKNYATGSNDNIEIGIAPYVSAVRKGRLLIKGYWVQAWVWVPNQNDDLDRLFRDGLACPYPSTYPGGNYK